VCGGLDIFRLLLGVPLRRGLIVPTKRAIDVIVADFRFPIGEQNLEFKMALRRRTPAIKIACSVKRQADGDPDTLLHFFDFSNEAIKQATPPPAGLLFEHTALARLFLILYHGLPCAE
jgi:hypothetical protein